MPFFVSPTGITRNYPKNIKPIMLSWYIVSLRDQIKLEPLIPDQSGFP